MLLKLIPVLFIMILCQYGYSQNNQGEISCELNISSDHLIPGESAEVQIVVAGARAQSRPPTPEIPGASFEFTGISSQIINGQDVYDILSYRLTPAKTGTYTIPAMNLKAGNQTVTTNSLTFSVQDTSSLTKIPTGVTGADILAIWIPSKRTLYPGEQCPTSIKLYIPRRLNIVGLGMLETTKENCLGWRFESSNGARGRLAIKGEQYITKYYSSTLSGIGPGAAKLTECSLGLTSRQRVIDRRIGSRLRDVEINIELPSLELEIIPFPKGAPANFKGAVGNFLIGVQCQKPELTENESTEVILQVAGTGNIENIKAPALEEDKESPLDWKIIDTSKVTRGSERHDLSGSVFFRQLLRPIIKDRSNLTEATLSIPGYSFCFFDPETKTYNTLTTEPIPVTVTPSSEPLDTEEDSLTPQPTEKEEVEEMTGILGFIKEGDALSTKSVYPTAAPKTKLWHILPALLCLYIIFKPLFRKLSRNLGKSPEAAQKLSELKALAKTDDGADFYKRAGNYITQWLSATKAGAPSTELETIISERDSYCFQPEKQRQTKLTEERKKEIIDLLKKLSLILCYSCISYSALFLSPRASAEEPPNAESLWEKGQYQEAIDYYYEKHPSAQNSIAETPANVFYNLGNCYYKLEQKGKAALAWRRTLAVYPAHTSARKNLRYLEDETNPLSPKYEPWQDQLTTYSNMSPQTLITIAQVALWLFIISLFIIIFSRSEKRYKKLLPALICIAVIAPTIVAAGYFIAYSYPDTDLIVPYEQQAVFLDKTPVYSDAHRESNTVLTAPAGSLAKIIAKRDSWVYLRIIDDNPNADYSKGWVQAKQIEPVTSSR